MLALVGTGSAGATVCGDADGNGVVTTNDGVRILLIAATDGACETDGCDVDGDGRIGVTDAVLALRRAVGLPIVDRCGPGVITGRLLVLPAATTANARSEREPNDGPGTADVVGRLAAGGVRRVHGTLDPDDPFDAFTFTSASGVRLTLDLTFPADPTIDLDLLIDDRHGHALTCEGATPGREHCELALDATAAEAFDVVVAPATGSAPAAYTLVVRAQQSRTGVNRVAAVRGAGAPIDLDPAVYRGEAAAIATGEIVLQMADGSDGSDGRAPAAAGGVGRATLAAVVADAGLAHELAPAIVAPDGSALVVLPATRANAARRAGRPAPTLAAKRAHAADRARTRAVAATLATSPHVVSAEPNRVVRAARVPTDPRFPEQWHLDALDLRDAWNTTIGNPSAIVAVIDTGIRSDHPDLAGRLVAGFDFISNPTRANDGDGLDPDPFDPGDLPTTPAGGTFHGTHVAGTIGAATNNGIGVAGVTWRTAVMPLRVLGVAGGTVFDVAQAIRFAARLSNSSGTLPPRRANVINLSLTTSGDDPVLRNAVDAATAAGVLVVAAAGNTGSNGFLSPAGFPNVVSVAATDRLGNPARYSNFGPTITVAAPGGDTHHDRDADGRPDGILSTLLPGLEPYARMQGTSMASAHASGVAALLLGVPGGASASRLRAILLATADDRGAPGRDDRYGAGILNAARAVRMLAGTAPPDEPIFRLETPSVRVAGDESAPRVALRNAGSGSLVVTAVSRATDDGSAWLTPFVEGSFLRVAVDRDALAPGVYTGRVHVDSNGGAAELAVVAEVAATPPEDLGPVTVVLRAIGSRAPVATVVTTVSADYRYRFEGMPPGQYEIVATTDEDGDGEICDVGEECGAYPERLAPSPVTVLGGTTIRARDFGLSFVISRVDPIP